MREILFRGKRVDNGEWVYGSLLQEEKRCFIGNYVHKIMHNSKVSFSGRRSGIETNKWKIFGLVEVIPETVGQYTGLKDKNGEKIFEKDVLKQQLYQDGKPYGNYYKEVKWGISSNKNGFNIANGKKWEKIGTIFDKEGNDEENYKS